MEAAAAAAMRASATVTYLCGGESHPVFDFAGAADNTLAALTPVVASPLARACAAKRAERARKALTAPIPHFPPPESPCRLLRGEFHQAGGAHHVPRVRLPHPVQKANKAK